MCFLYADLCCAAYIPCKEPIKFKSQSGNWKTKDICTGEKEVVSSSEFEKMTASSFI